jgi:hypothetical protein
MERIAFYLFCPTVDDAHHDPASCRALTAGACIPRSLAWKDRFRRLDKRLNGNAFDDWSQTGGCGCPGADLENVAARKFLWHSLFWVR